LHQFQICFDFIEEIISFTCVRKVLKSIHIPVANLQYCEKF
jgi:hypothetical protein